MAPYLAESASEGQSPHTPAQVIRDHCGGLHTPPGGVSPVGGSSVEGLSPGASSRGLSPASTPPATPPIPMTQQTAQDDTLCEVSPDPGHSPGGQVMYFIYPPPPHYPYPPGGALLQYPVALPPGLPYHSQLGYVTLPPLLQGMPQCQVVYSQEYPVSSSSESPSSPIEDPSVLEVGPASSPIPTSGVVSPVSDPVSTPAPVSSTPNTDPQHPLPSSYPYIPPPFPDHPPTCPDHPPLNMVPPPPPVVPASYPGHASMVCHQAYMGYPVPGGGVPMYTVAAMSPMGATGEGQPSVQVMNSYSLPAPVPAHTAVQYASPPAPLPPSLPSCPGAPPSSMTMAPTAAAGSVEDWKNEPLISQKMELVWHGEFNSRFVTFGPHRWYLIPVEKPPGETAATLWPSDLYLPSVPWRTFRDSAKVRFCCDSCGNGWTSMKGRVIFWFYQDPKDMQGYVLFKLYGQQCKRCANGQFEHAMWYPDEVVKVIENMYNRVGQVYYSFYRPPIRIERRSGKPREQHNSELCQACKEGLCQEELMFT